MKRHALFCLVATLLAAQAVTPEVELTAEPHHHLTFENKYIRVYNVEVPSHSDTLMHWHRHDYIYVTLGATDVVNEVKGKPPATLHLEDGETHFSPAPFAHIASNRSDQPFRNVTIEIVADESLRTSAAHGDVKWDEDRALETFPGGTQQILWVRDGIRASEFELQPGGQVPMHRYAGPHLFVAVNGFDLKEEEEDIRRDIKPIAIHFNSGDHKWLPPNYSHPLTNTGKAPAKFVTLEFP